MMMLSLLSHLLAILPVAAFTASPQRSFAINAAFDVKPDRRDDFLKIIKSDIEPKAIQSVLGQDVDDANRFYLHQEFESRDDYNGPATYKNEQGVPLFETDPFNIFPVINDFELCHDGYDKRVTNVKGALCLNVEICIKPEVREEFLEVIANNKAGSDAEPLCMQYSWGEAVHAFNTFHFHEQYKGDEGLNAHFEGDHFKVWEKFASKDDSPFVRPPIVQKFLIL
jgi:quinol monooxygenase YgiN